MLQSFIPGRAFPGYGFPPGGAGPGGRRAPSGPSIEVIGPFHPTGKPVETESRARIFVCHPPTRAKKHSCAARIFSEHRAAGFPASGDRQRSGGADGVLQRGASELRHVSKAESRTASSRSSPAPSFCIGPSRRRRVSRLGPTIASAIWNWPRACRSSCGAPFPMTNCSRSPNRAS